MLNSFIHFCSIKKILILKIFNSAGKICNLRLSALSEILAHNLKKKPSRLRQFIREISAIFVTLGRFLAYFRSRYPRFFSIYDVTIQDTIFCVAPLESWDPGAQFLKKAESLTTIYKGDLSDFRNPRSIFDLFSVEIPLVFLNLWRHYSRYNFLRCFVVKLRSWRTI